MRGELHTRLAVCSCSTLWLVPISFHNILFTVVLPTALWQVVLTRRTCACARVCYYWNPSAGSWSASTSPARSPSPSRFGHHHSATHHGTSSSHTGGSHHSRSRGGHSNAAMYGTTSLCQRSRSPSPARLQEMRERNNRFDHDEMGTCQNFPLFSLSVPLLFAYWYLWAPLSFCYFVSSGSDPFPIYLLLVSVCT